MPCHCQLCLYIHFQVLSAVSQLSSLFNGLRTLSHSSSGRPQKKRESVTTTDTKGSTHHQQTRSSAEELFFSTELVRFVVLTFFMIFLFSVDWKILLNFRYNIILTHSTNSSYLYIATNLLSCLYTSTPMLTWSWY